jgi:hypothetical protein
VKRILGKRKERIIPIKVAFSEIDSAFKSFKVEGLMHGIFNRFEWKSSVSVMIQRITKNIWLFTTLAKKSPHFCDILAFAFNVAGNVSRCFWDILRFQYTSLHTVRGSKKIYVSTSKA